MIYSWQLFLLYRWCCCDHFNCSHGYFSYPVLLCWSNVVL